MVELQVMGQAREKKKTNTDWKFTMWNVVQVFIYLYAALFQNRLKWLTVLGLSDLLGCSSQLQMGHWDLVRFSGLCKSMPLGRRGDRPIWLQRFCPFMVLHCWYLKIRKCRKRPAFPTQGYYLTAWKQGLQFRSP